MMDPIRALRDIQRRFAGLNHTLTHQMSLASSRELLDEYARHGRHRRNVPSCWGHRRDAYWWDAYDWKVDGEADCRDFLEVAADMAGLLCEGPPEEWSDLTPGTMQAALGSDSALHRPDYWVLVLYHLAWKGLLPYECENTYHVGESLEDEQFCLASRLPVDIVQVSEDALLLFTERAPEIRWDAEGRRYVWKRGGAEMPTGKTSAPCPATEEKKGGAATPRDTLSEAEESGQSEEEATEEADAQPDKGMLEWAICCSVSLRDLARLRRYYPDAIDPGEAAELEVCLLNFLGVCLDSSGFEKFKKLPIGGDHEDDLQAEATYNALFTVLLLNHPSLQEKESPLRDRAAINDVLNEARDAAPEAVRHAARRLFEMSVYDCKYPSPRDDESFQDPRRLLQMLREYWARCRSVIVQESKGLCHTVPHALSSLLMNLRRRTELCFQRLSHLSGADGAAGAVNTLLDMLLGGESEDLCLVPEWTTGQIQTVDHFLEEMRLSLGSRSYVLTHAEKLFLEQADAAIDQYLTAADRAWSAMVARAGQIAKRHDDVTIETPQQDGPADSFPSPDGAAWESVDIQFKDRHTVSIRVGDVTGVYNYTQMGMVDKRSSNPTVQWELLHSFATGHGVLTWEHSDASRKNQKRRENLAKDLRAFFGIEDDPFELTANRKGWRTRFSISPE